MNRMKRLFRCCICGKSEVGYGNSPEPLMSYDGRPFKQSAKCCLACNNDYVIEYRLGLLNFDDKKCKQVQGKVKALIKSWKIMTLTIERPDGTTYEQDVESVNNSIKDTMCSYQKKLGHAYNVVSASMRY